MNYSTDTSSARAIADAIREYENLVTDRVMALLAQRPRKMRNPKPRRMGR